MLVTSKTISLIDLSPTGETIPFIGTLFLILFS